MRVCGDCPNVRFEESARKGETFIRCKNDLPDIRFRYRVVAVVPTGYERKSADRLAPPMWGPKQNEP